MLFSTIRSFSDRYSHVTRRQLNCVSVFPLHFPSSHVSCFSLLTFLPLQITWAYLPCLSWAQTQYTRTLLLLCERERNGLTKCLLSMRIITPVVCLFSYWSSGFSSTYRDTLTEVFFFISRLWGSSICCLDLTNLVRSFLYAKPSQENVCAGECSWWSEWYAGCRGLFLFLVFPVCGLPSLRITSLVCCFTSCTSSNFSHWI